MADPIGAGMMPGANANFSTSQNLFEHAATKALEVPQGTGPMQLGQQILQNMQGYVGRAGSLADRADKARTDQVSVAMKLVSPGAGKSEASALEHVPVQKEKSVSDAHMDRAIDSLGLMFNHAIETQLVVRGTTQLSGAASTLMRGQ